jgi:hypothetical protein
MQIEKRNQNIRKLPGKPFALTTIVLCFVTGYLVNNTSLKHYFWGHPSLDEIRLGTGIFSFICSMIAVTSEPNVIGVLALLFGILGLILATIVI